MIRIEIRRHVAANVYEGDLLSGRPLFIINSVILGRSGDILSGNVRERCSFDDDWTRLLFFIDVAEASIDLIRAFSS